VNRCLALDSHQFLYRDRHNKIIQQNETISKVVLFLFLTNFIYLIKKENVYKLLKKISSLVSITASKTSKVVSSKILSKITKNKIKPPKSLNFKKNCITFGCDGMGHINGTSLYHNNPSNCPKAKTINLSHDQALVAFSSITSVDASGIQGLQYDNFNEINNNTHHILNTHNDNFFMEQFNNQFKLLNFFLSNLRKNNSNIASGKKFFRKMNENYSNSFDSCTQPWPYCIQPYQTGFKRF
jgi:hypothetical protein